MNLKIDQIVAWAAAIFILAGAFSTSYDFVPWNKLLYGTGCVLWIISGYIWKQSSIVTMNIICAIMFFSGFLFGS